MSALVRWLPELAVATADDIARFGPNAARVRSLLDFIPTMSRAALDATSSAVMKNPNVAATKAAREAASSATTNAARQAFREAARSGTRNTPWKSGYDAARAEVVSDLISPEVYRTLINPLATGRAVDVLRPRFDRTPFRELITELGPKQMITQPSDVLNVARIAGSPEEIRDIALQLLKDGGMTIEEAYQAARLLA